MVLELDAAVLVWLVGLTECNRVVRHRRGGLRVRSSPGYCSSSSSVSTGAPVA
jgi:hypothetical protein